MLLIKCIVRSATLNEVKILGEAGGCEEHLGFRKDVQRTGSLSRVSKMTLSFLCAIGVDENNLNRKHKQLCRSKEREIISIPPLFLL